MAKAVTECEEFFFDEHSEAFQGAVGNDNYSN